MSRVCEVDGCESPHKGHGYCEKHLLRWRKYGDPSVVRRRQPNPDRPRTVCFVEGCDQFTVGRGLCRNHYVKKQRRGGDLSVNLPRGNFSTPVSERLNMFEKNDTTGCWEWKGYINRRGYGVVGRKGSIVLAHRAMYQELVGPIGEGLTLDHLCGNETCVNPEHLDPCSRKENLFRGGRPHFDLRGKSAHY